MMSRAVVGSWAAGQPVARPAAARSVVGRPTGMGRSLAQTGDRARSTQQLPAAAAAGPPRQRRSRRSGPPPPLGSPPPPAAASSGSPAEPSEASLGDAASGTAAARSPGAAAPASGATQLAWNDFSRLFKGSGLNSSEISAAWQEYKATGELPGSTLPQEAAEPDPSGSRRRPAVPAHSNSGAEWRTWNDFQNAFRGVHYTSKELSAAYKYYKETNEVPAELRDLTDRRVLPSTLPPGLDWNRFCSYFGGFGYTSRELSTAWSHYKVTGRVPDMMRMQPTQPPAAGDGGEA